MSTDEETIKYRKDKNNQQSEQNTMANVHQRNDSQITDFDKTQENDFDILCKKQH